MPRISKGEQKAPYFLSSVGSRFNPAAKRAGIRRRNPYHTRHTYAGLLPTYLIVLPPGAAEYQTMHQTQDVNKKERDNLKKQHQKS